MKNFCKDLKKHATKIISYEKKKSYHQKLKEINHIASKELVIHAKINLVLMTVITNTINSEITVITPENIKALLVMFVI